MADVPPVLTASGQEWQFQVSYKQINWQMYPLILTSSGQIWQIYPRSTSRCTPPLTSSDQEWQFQISIVTAHIKRSTGRSTPSPTNALWDIYYGMNLAAILDSSRKGGNFLLFLNNLSSKQSVSIVESYQM